MWKAIRKSAKILMKILFRVELINKENIPSEGRAILCGNHISGWDGPLTIASAERTAYILAKQELWKNKIVGHILDKNYAIPIDRENVKKESLRKAIKVLEAEKLLIIFIEGTRNGIAKGQDPKRGAAFFSSLTKAPVIPFKIVGNYHIFGKVKVIFGKPFVIANIDDGTKKIMQAIEQIEIPEKQKSYKKLPKLNV